MLASPFSLCSIFLLTAELGSRRDKMETRRLAKLKIRTELILGKKKSFLRSQPHILPTA